jgi:enamine deaminase RidA (YjgF/YER057c/UK114 family)
MSVVEDRLRELGLALPPAKTPVANYLGTKRSGDLLFVSGRVSQRRGEVGTELTVEEARPRRATRCSTSAIIKQDLGDLDRIVSVEQVRGFRVPRRRSPSNRVIDGASELLIALYGDAGRHARTATGAAQLVGAAVQLDLVVRLR